MDEVLRTLALLPEKGNIKELQRLQVTMRMQYADGLIWREHCREVTDYYLTELQPNRIQVDEI
jgi:hypothetical protein